MSDRSAGPLRLSVIVPAWNDHANLALLLPQLVRLSALHEVIVADASADPRTAALVEACGGIYLRARQPNRGAQMNLAAKTARGDVFIFHHADSILRDAHLEAIRRALGDPEVIGGAFFRAFDGRHPRLMFLENVGRFLSRHGGTFFGDQSVFVRRENFALLGGFAAIPLMEDMEFSRRLRRAGKVAVLDPPVASSDRRHLRRGAWRTSVQNGLFILLYQCGVAPSRLHRWYYRERLAVPNESTGTPELLEEFRGSRSLE